MSKIWVPWEFREESKQLFVQGTLKNKKSDVATCANRTEEF